MRNLIAIMLVFLTVQVGLAQEQEDQKNVYFGAGLNPVTLLSEDTHGDLDWTIELGANVGENGGVAFFYERYNAENFIAYGFRPQLQATIVDGLQISLGLEGSLIERYDRDVTLLGTSERRATFATYGFNSDLSYRVGDVAFVYGGDVRRRPDLHNQDWELSSTLGLRFFFN